MGSACPKSPLKPIDLNIMRLANATLSTLPGDIKKPHYDRAALRPAIVHIGVGNFHRAHQAWYLHRLMQMGKAMDWALIGAGIRPYDARMREKLQAQDYLTTLVELDPAGKSAEVIGSMIDYLPVEDGNGPLIAQMSDPAIRIVSLTVTEGGYFIDPLSHTLQGDHPDIQHDACHPDHPRTVFGAMLAALRQRRAHNIPPFTGLSCDNLQGNGTILRQTLVELARLSDPDFADWLESCGCFPNSMVDCIVPATGPREQSLVQQMGIDDQAPVTHENFRQWVIEDQFSIGRPDWDEVGAVFSDRVHDFETMKLRILNGGHQIIASAGDLLGIETIADTMAHPLIRASLEKIVQEEIAPHIQPVPGHTPQSYLRVIMKRFDNPEIFDTTRRVAFDGSSRQPGFILPSVHDGLAKGTPISGLALVQALWAHYCAGVREDGSLIAPNDPLWDDLTACATKARANSSLWLSQHHIYGELTTVPEFSGEFSRWLAHIVEQGVENTLRAYLK